MEGGGDGSFPVSSRELPSYRPSPAHELSLSKVKKWVGVVKLRPSCCQCDVIDLLSVILVVVISSYNISNE